MNSHSGQASQSLESGKDSAFIAPEELTSFRQQSDRLMASLRNNDVDIALKCLTEINRVHDQKYFTIIGKITRGLHNAINDLGNSADDSGPRKQTNRAGLGYVMEVTGNAAQLTLDMTENSRACITRVNASLDQQAGLIRTARSANGSGAAPEVLDRLESLMAANRVDLSVITGNINEITLAQNYQDLTSQSINKAVRIINNVESSLVSLTQYTSLLKQLSLIAAGDMALDAAETHELQTNLEQLERVTEPEHMDQDDVDNLLSSLGF